MPIKKKKIVEKVVAFEGEQDFIVSSNSPDYISAGEVLFVGATGVPSRGTPVFQIPDWNSLDCAMLGQSISQLENYINTYKDSIDAASLTIYQSELLKAKGLYTAKCPVSAPTTTPCDATIDQINVNVQGTTATISAIIKSSKSPITNQVRYSLDGNDAITTNSTFQLTNLSSGSHSITIAALCSDGGTSPKQTKSFTIDSPVSITPNAPKTIDPNVLSLLNTSNVSPTPTTTVTSTTTFVPPFAGGGFGGVFGGGGSESETQTVKKDQFPWLLVILITGGLFLLTRKRKKD